MMDFQKWSKASNHTAPSEWENKAARGCKRNGARVRAGTCTRALFQRPFCIVPPTRTTSGALCSQQLVSQHFVIDFATVLTSDINSGVVRCFQLFSFVSDCLGAYSYAQTDNCHCSGASVQVFDDVG